MRILLLSVLAVMFTGCFECYEEIKLNKDGSGNYVYMFDASALIDNDMFMGPMKESMGMKMTDALEEDSIGYLKSLPDSRKDGRPAFWNKVKMRRVMSEKKKQFYTFYSFPFSSLEEVNYFLSSKHRVLEMNDQLPGDGNFEDNPILAMLDTRNVRYSLSRGELVRQGPDYKALNGKSEDTDMYKMIYRDVKYNLSYSLPGKVGKTSFQNAVTADNNFTITATLTDLVDGKANLNGYVQFR